MRVISNSQSGTAVKGWKAIVLYTDAQSGSNAQKLLSRIAWQTKSGDAWQTNLWRFDVMANQPVADLALQDAQDAQLVFLSVRSISEPPHWLLSWLEAWAHKRRGRASAIVAWCQHLRGEAPTGGTERLRQFARDHQVAFLCADDYAVQSRD